MQQDLLNEISDRTRAYVNKDYACKAVYVSMTSCISPLPPMLAPYVSTATQQNTSAYPRQARCSTVEHACSRQNQQAKSAGRIVCVQQPHSTLHAIADAVASLPMLLQSEAAEIQNSELDHATSHLGKAVGITQLLRGTVYHAQRRRVYLPTDLMVREGVTEDQLTSGQPSPELNNVVYEVASTAKVMFSSVMLYHT